VEGVEGYSKEVLNVVNFASIVGLSCGGDEKTLLDIFLVIEEEREPKKDISTSKVKEKRELKNLECSINFEARGRDSSMVNCIYGFCGFRANKVSLGFFGF
jgi:hypothetical protein